MSLDALKTAITYWDYILVELESYDIESLKAIPCNEFMCLSVIQLDYMVK